MPAAPFTEKRHTKNNAHTCSKRDVAGALGNGSCCYGPLKPLWGQPRGKNGLDYKLDRRRHLHLTGGLDNARECNVLYTLYLPRFVGSIRHYPASKSLRPLLEIVLARTIHTMLRSGDTHITTQRSPDASPCDLLCKTHRTGWCAGT
jgi:hypothetical protein